MPVINRRESGNHLDPRIEKELNNLNSILLDINGVEKILEEARLIFKKKLRSASRSLIDLEKRLSKDDFIVVNNDDVVKKNFLECPKQSTENHHQLGAINESGGSTNNFITHSTTRKLFLEKKRQVIKKLKEHVTTIRSLEDDYKTLNKSYTHILHSLERISEETHQQRCHPDDDDDELLSAAQRTRRIRKISCKVIQGASSSFKYQQDRRGSRMYNRLEHHLDSLVDELRLGAVVGSSRLIKKRVSITRWGTKNIDLNGIRFGRYKDYAVIYFAHGNMLDDGKEFE